MPTLKDSYITPSHRDVALASLKSEPYDVIVIGGGVTGAGTALDAASRGLRTALIERVDLAAGTSRWSSKLAHGGLRYLAKLDFGVAWESAVERACLLTTIAPHMIRTTPFMVPMNDITNRTMGLLIETGVRMADIMRIATRVSNRLLPIPRRVNATKAHQLAAGLATDSLRGGLIYWDGQIEDDARLVTEIARTARFFGADIVTRCAASQLGPDSVVLTDTLTGDSFKAHGIIINATGVWASEWEHSLTISPSRGTHLVFRSKSLGDPKVIFTSLVPNSFGRAVFVIPQTSGLCYLGLTDEPAEGADGIKPPIPESDEKFLLNTINLCLKKSLTHNDIVGRFAGLRPLVRTSGGSTPDISRKHLLIDREGCPITIAGGKLTTYRRMSQDAVDAAVKRISRNIPPCHTKNIALVNAKKPKILPTDTETRRLARRYGSAISQIRELTRQYPWLGQHVAPNCPTIAAEFAYGVLAEGAICVEDLIERRTRVSMVTQDIAPATEVAHRVLNEFYPGKTKLSKD